MYGPETVPRRRMPRILIFLVAVLCSPFTEAQTWDEAFGVFQNDGAVRVFYRSKVDSIVYSSVDEKKSPPQSATQDIHIADKVYRIPLTLIDSVVFSPQGLPSGACDDRKTIVIPEQPALAVLNISGIDAFPVQKNVEKHAWVEVISDVADGIAFKKKAVVKLQGRSTTQLVKKGFSIDFCEDDWKGEETTGIKIGSWVTQDSYHFKAYYTSYTKGECPVGYKLYDKFMVTKPEGHRAPFNDYGIVDEEARCYPDGFPCLVYLNRQFYGLYSWQLKKHRDNYHQKRNETGNIHLDGVIGPDQLWNGKVSWTSFEVRNPKPKSSKWTLLCQDGKAYDGDNPRELMGKDSPHYDSSNVNCLKTAQVKEIILSLSRYMNEIAAYEDAYKNATPDELEGALSVLKEQIQKRFSMEYLIDYIILVTFLQNSDSTANNWQWLTWGDIDGTVKWYVCPYDLDHAFGVISTTGFRTANPYIQTVGASTNTPARYVWNYYLDEMKARYRELRTAGVLSYETVWGIMEDWVSRIGEDNYEREMQRWPETPANRDACISPAWTLAGKEYLTYTDAPSNWGGASTYSSGAFCKYNHRCYRSLQDANKGHLPDEPDSKWWEDVFVRTKTYKAGETVYDGWNNFYEFRALEDVTVVGDEGNDSRPDGLCGAPFEKFYSHYPYEGGTHDSPERVRQWILDKIALMDKQMGYKQSGIK